jgi:anti-sigma regulatory factor (Ser/Thr protein kinase)
MIAMAPPRPSSQHGPSRPVTVIPQLEPDPAQPAPPPACRFALNAGAQAAAEARGQLRRLVSVWEMRVDVDVLVLLASELITNAVTHTETGTAGAGAISVCVRCLRGELRVEVHDGSHDMPVPVPLDVDDDAETGRGLMLVDALAAEWGFYRTPRGKAVYFTLPLRAA